MAVGEPLRGPRPQLRPGRGAVPAVPRRTRPSVDDALARRTSPTTRRTAAPTATSTARAPAAAPAPASAPPRPGARAAAPRRRREPGAASALDGDEPRTAARRRRAHRREHGGEPRRSRPRPRCARCPRSCSRSTARSSTTSSRAPARGKVSFTHLIALRGAARAAPTSPNLNSAYGVVDGKPAVVRHQHVNLGLAVDVQSDATARTRCSCPNIKDADTLDFAGFCARVRGAHRARCAATRSRPTTSPARPCTITNPGMIGTVHSVPRLMPGQGFIVGVGAIGYPAEYEGADPQTLAELGVSKVTTLTSTYDHRIITGAESGEFLRRIHELLLGERRLLRRHLRQLRRAVRAGPLEPRPQPLADPATQHEKVVQVHTLINMYRVRGHLIANLDPLGRREPTHAPRARHHALRPDDLGPRPRVPDRRPRPASSPRTDAAARHPRRAARRVLAHDRRRVHAHPGARPEGVDPGAGRGRARRPSTAAEKRRILERLNAAEAFERFLHTKYLGQKRFSLEGAETLIPMLDALLHRRRRRRHERGRARHGAPRPAQRARQRRSASRTGRSSASSRASSTRRARRAPAT